MIKTSKNIAKPQSKSQWKALGYRVPTKCKPVSIDYYYVPGYRTVMRERYLYGADQVVKIDPEQARVRALASQKAIATRMKNMEDRASTAELTINSDYSDREVYELALATHGGNYAGDPGPFSWSNRKATNTIRATISPTTSDCGG